MCVTTIILSRIGTERKACIHVEKCIYSSTDIKKFDQLRRFLYVVVINIMNDSVQCNSTKTKVLRHEMSFQDSKTGKKP